MSPVTNGLWVEPNIVDRPGVPAELFDKYWVAWGQAGHVGTTALLIKPPNEGTLGGDAGRLASVVLDDESGDPLVGPNGVTVIIRDIRTGATLRTFESSIDPSYALVTGSLLFWRGLTLPIDAPDRMDAGVWVIDLADPASTPQAIIPPADLSLTYGPRATRSLLRLTDGGRAVTSTLVGETSRATEIIDVASLSLRALLADEIAYQIAGGVALIHRGNRLALLDLATGREIGPGVREDVVLWSVVGEGELFASFGRDQDLVIAAIDLETGEAREILVRAISDLRLSPELSTPHLIVLLHDDDPTYDAQGRVQIPVSLLDPATGNLQLDAFTIGNP